MPFWLQLAIVLLTLGALAVIVGMFIRASFSFAPWVPSKIDLLKSALENLRVKPGQRFVDLGSGDGRAVFLASKSFGLQASGYEISPLPYALAKVRQLFQRRFQTRFYFKNLFSASLSEFDIIYIYGLPKILNDKLKPKLEKEARPGTYVLSYNFSLTGHQPIKILSHSWRRLLIYQL